MAVKINNPELRAAAEEETKKYRAEVAWSLLEPLIRAEQANLKQLKKISDRYSTDAPADTIDELFQELHGAMQAGNYEAFSLEMQRRVAARQKYDVDTVPPFEDTILTVCQDYLKKYEALVEGKFMPAVFNYFNNRAGTFVESYTALFKPEFKNNTFVVGEIKKQGEVNIPLVEKIQLPLSGLREDFNFYVGSVAPLQPQTMNVE